MLSTLGGILTVVGVLLCLLGIGITLVWLHAARVLRAWKQVSPATPPEKAPQTWESRLADLQADVVSLSSSFEKVTKAVTRQNQRDVMRDRRSAASAPSVPPEGATKAELYRAYGLAGKTHREIAQRALELIHTENERQH